MRCLLPFACFCLVVACGPITRADDKPREIKIAIKADDRGNPAEVEFNGTALPASGDVKRTSLQALHDLVVEVLLDAGGMRRPGKVETLVDIDGGLKYAHVQAAIEAFGRHQARPDGAAEPLVDAFRLVVHEENEGRTTLDLQLFEYVAGAAAPGAVAVDRPPEEPIVLQINREGNVHYAGSGFVEPEIIRRRLGVKKTFLMRTGHDFKEATIVILAEAKCTMTQVGKVLAAARAQGFEVFAFRTAAAVD